MAIIRTIVGGLGGMSGLVTWYVIMRVTGLWSIFLTALYSHYLGKLVALFGFSLLVCGFFGGAAALALGERLRLFPSQEKLEQQARPVSLFSDPNRSE